MQFISNILFYDLSIDHTVNTVKIDPLLSERIVLVMRTNQVGEFLLIKSYVK